MFLPMKYFACHIKKGILVMVKIGNHVTSKIFGTGEVTLMTENGSKLVLEEVRHVPEMRLNLISI